MLLLRRIAWMRWLPPMESPSPSPVMTNTLRSDRVTLMPVAMAGARPWMEWNP